MIPRPQQQHQQQLWGHQDHEWLPATAEPAECSPAMMGNACSRAQPEVTLALYMSPGMPVFIYKALMGWTRLKQTTAGAAPPWLTSLALLGGGGRPGVSLRKTGTHPPGPHIVPAEMNP